MPLRSPKMKSFIFGFQRFVWWPKCTPASSSSFMLTGGVTLVPCVVFTVVAKPSSSSAAGHAGPVGLPAPSRRLEMKRLNQPPSLTLAELEAAPGALLSVLLALLDAGVPREESRLLEALPEFQVELAQRARDAVADGSRLRRRTTAGDDGQHVELLGRLRDREGLLGHHLQRFVAAEVVVEGLVVEMDLARAGAQPHARDGRLALSGRVVLDGCAQTL